MKFQIRCLLCLLLSIMAVAANAYQVEYIVKFNPEKSQAQVKLLIDNSVDSNSKARPVKELSFKNKTGLHSNFKANGKLKISRKTIVWQPPTGKAWLSLDVNLLHERDAGEYDSFINKDWALFRGDDLFPPVRISTSKNALAVTRLKFELPKDWPFVNTAWLRNEARGRGHKAEFIVDNPERRFDRPTGWMIAGKIATRRDVLGETLVSISSPKRISFEKEGPGLKRMEALTLLHFVWPEIQKILPAQPQSLLIVGAGDPMWRGGLSAPNSLYMHAERPLISENSSSTLLHELFHSLTRIRGKKNDDWIAEGLAEYYSLVLLYRSNGMSEERLNSAFAKLQKRSKKVKKIRKAHSAGATTAKAVLVFHSLDDEIKLASKGKYSLDDVVKKLAVQKAVSLSELRAIVRDLIGRESKSLKGI